MKKEDTLVVVTSLDARDKPVFVKTERFSNQFNAILEAVTSVNPPKGDFEIEQMKLGLAVSGSGDIGIVKAGVEASVEVLIKKKPAPKG